MLRRRITCSHFVRRGICSPASGDRQQKHQSIRTKKECEEEGNRWTEPVEEAEFESCMDREKKKFEKENEGCCSCDAGALFQDTCPNSKPDGWDDIDDNKRRKEGRVVLDGGCVLAGVPGGQS